MAPAVVFSFVGVLMFVIALVAFVKAQGATSGGVTVPGRVVDHESYRGNRGRTMYTAVFEATIDGRTVKCRSNIGKSWRGPAVGTPVSLVWVPRTGTLLEGGVAPYLVAIIVGAIGAGMLLVSGIIFATVLTAPADHGPTRDHATPRQQR